MRPGLRHRIVSQGPRGWSVAFTLAAACCAISANAQQLQGFDIRSKAPARYAVPTFYSDPATLPAAAEPGTIVRFERIGAPAGAKAWRVVYLSQDWEGRPAIASGMVIAPKASGKDKRPILAWAHGTTGAAPGCAPSLVPDPARSFTERDGQDGLAIDAGVPYLSDFLDRGYVVIAPDYAGLGAGSGHQYMVGDSAARDILNLARAARRLGEAEAGTNVSLLGWSQGGQAVLDAGEMAADYAPDLKLESIAALAPATTLMSPQVNALFHAAVPYVYLIASGFTSAYGLSLDAFNAHGKALVTAARETCVVDLFRQISASDRPGVDGDITAFSGWADALERNNTGRRASAAPVLLIHGTADQIVAPAGTPLYIQRARALGTDVSVHWIEGGDHRSIIPIARMQILRWIDSHAGLAPKTDTRP